MVRASDAYIVRRMDFFTCTMAPGQSFVDCRAELQCLVDEAGMHNMLKEELLVCRYVGAATDEKLRRRFGQFADPTLVEQEVRGNAHELQQRHQLQ